jgi:hypothetical protein
MEMEVDEVRVARRGGGGGGGGGGEGREQGDFSFEKFRVIQRLLGDHLHGQLDRRGRGRGGLKVCHLIDCGVGPAEWGGRMKQEECSVVFHQGKVKVERKKKE